eukprot:gb/GFBE01007164.1/.p1 GENE.gb/GFBE01007164.1/~~gb/GFBE01007164.1/.p1  ORF type:complete len:276 (+),score=47.67 gb/GFBE01007164.1/:1-828(+)
MADLDSLRSGARAAAAVIGLGKLQRQTSEIFVIEECGEADICVHKATVKKEPWMHKAEDRSPAPRTLEDDLVLEDCDSDDEVRVSSSSSSMGRMTARRLMQSRAQQCIVCMEEKEHTFVPQHAADSAHHVQGHRFCSDCWVDFLDHSLHALRRGVAGPLSCPVCRGCISVPDFWAVDVDLPAAWTQTRTSSQVKAEVAVLTSVADAAERAAAERQYWVDDAGRMAADDCTPVHARGPAHVCRQVWNNAVRQGAHCLRTLVTPSGGDEFPVPAPRS